MPPYAPLTLRILSGTHPWQVQSGSFSSGGAAPAVGEGAKGVNFEKGTTPAVEVSGAPPNPLSTTLSHDLAAAKPVGWPVHAWSAEACRVFAE